MGWKDSGWNTEVGLAVIALTGVSVVIGVAIGFLVSWLKTVIG